MQALQKKSEKLTEEVSVYGISDGSRYVDIGELPELEEDEVYISASFGDKYDLKKGDIVTLDEKYEDEQYRFKVAGIYDSCQNIAVFMPIEHYRSLFALDEDDIYRIYVRLRDYRH